jgi:hypothetical protein
MPLASPHETPVTYGSNRRPRQDVPRNMTGPQEPCVTRSHCRIGLGRARTATIAAMVAAAAVLAGCDGGPAQPSPSASPSHTQTALKAWTSGHLVMTQDSLGAVTIGMTLQRASAAAGEPLTPVGDGVYYPRGDESTGLSVQAFQGTVGCVSATAYPGHPVPHVRTAQGFPLGGTLARLKAAYGDGLHYVPAPAGGIEIRPGYVVRLPGGNLSFYVTGGIVRNISGGPRVVPSTDCQ